MARTDQRTKLIKGTVTNDSADAGYVGEYVSSVVSAVSASNSLWADVTSISLTAGDWDLTGIVHFKNNGATGNTYAQMGISTSSGNGFSDFSEGNNYILDNPALSGTKSHTASVPGYRVSIASTTNYYLKVNCDFSGGPVQCNGRISARRVR